MKKRTITQKLSRGIFGNLIGKLVLAVMLLSYAVGLQAQTASFPFPQNYKYTYGITATNADPTVIQARYAEWKAKYYEEGTWGGTPCARVKFLQPGETGTATVSEGIAYGMLIMVYMDNTTNASKACFDKLWAYYVKSKDAQGLMNWKMNAFTGTVVDANAAPDADIDVAQSLMMADKQWGSAGTVNYLSEAKALIGNIWKFEVQQYATGGLLVKPGDMFTALINPSYLITNATKLFSTVDANNWAGLNTACYALMKKSANATTGLVPDWVYPDGTLVKAGSALGDACSNCTANADGIGNSKFESYFLYDAIRVPWRMAQAYAWYGDADAKTLAGNIAKWSNTTFSGDPSNAMDGYYLGGTASTGLTTAGFTNKGTYHNACFTGGFGISGMVDVAYQSYLNNAWTKASVSEGANSQYFTSTTQLLYLLCMSGNMPNFCDMNPAPVSAYNNSTGGCSTIYVQFNKPMSSTSVAASKAGWTVTMDNANTAIPITINSVALGTDGKTVALTLAGPTEEPLIQVAYSGTPTLTSSDAKTVLAFSKFAVKDVNYCARAYPVSAATNIVADTVKIVFSKPMLATSFTKANFSVTVKGVAVIPTDIFADPTDPTLVQLKLPTGSVTANTDIITVTYTAGTLKSQDGGAPKSFTALNVINNFLTETCGNIETFETVSCTWTSWAPGTMSTTATDPTGTSKVGLFTKGVGTASNQYVAAKGDLPKVATSDSTLNARMATNYIFKMRVRVSKAGAVVRVRLQDRYKGGLAYATAISNSVTIAAANTWTDVALNFQSQLPSSTNLNEIQLDLEPDLAVTPAETIYFDDVRVCPPPASTSVTRGYTSYDGSQVRIQFNTAMAIPSDFSGFTLSAGAVAHNISSVTIDAVDKKILVFNMETPFAAADLATITASYAGTAVKGLNGLKLTAFTNQPIINLVDRAIALGWKDDFDINMVTDPSDVTANIGGDLLYTRTETAASGIYTVKAAAGGTTGDYKAWGPTVLASTSNEVWDLTADPVVRFSVAVPTGNTVWIRADVIDLVNGRSTDGVPAIKLTADGAQHTYAIDFTGKFVNQYGAGALAGPVDRTNIVGVNIYQWQGDGSTTPKLWTGTATYDWLSVGTTTKIYGEPAEGTNVSMGLATTAKSTAVGIIYLVPNGTPRIIKALQDSITKGIGTKAAVVTKDVAVSVPTTNLPAGYYIMYAFNSATGEVSRKSHGINIKDVTPPIITQASSGNFSPGDPVTASVNEDAIVYLVPVGTAKTKAAILNATGVIAVPVGKGETGLFTIPGTVTSGDQLMFYAIDYSDNISIASTPVIAIVDIKPPVLSAYTKGSVIIGTSTISATSNEAGSIYVVKQSDVASINSALTLATKALVTKVATAATPVSIAVTAANGFVVGTSYVLYAVDAAGNMVGPTEIITVDAGCVGITDIAVAPTSLSIKSGATGNLTVSVTAPANATAIAAADVSWYYANADGVFTLNGDNMVASGLTCTIVGGVVNMASTGTIICTVTGCDGNPISTNVDVTVSPAVTCPTAISLAPTTQDVKVNATGALTPTITGTMGSNTIVWSTSSSTNATVTGTNASATVTGKAIGTATITAAITCGATTISGTGKINVVKTPVTGVAVTSTTPVSIVQGLTSQATATVAPITATVQTLTWSSDKNAVATVDANGLISAIGVGTCTITVASSDDATIFKTIAVTVTPVAVTKIDFTPAPSTSMVVNGTQTITAVITPSTASDKSVTWSSTPSTVATVVGGLVTAKAAGTVTITATSVQNPAISQSIVIIVSDILPTQVVVSGTQAINVKGTSVLTATVTPLGAADKTVAWSSGSDLIATVDATGKVTGVAVGTVTITATSNIDKTVKGTIVITVSAVAVTGITLTPTGSQTMVVKEVKTFTAAVAPTTATDASLDWTSDNSTVATVTGGVVTAKAAGTVTITATSKSTPSIKTTVVIVISDILPTAISIAPTAVQNISVGGSTVLTATITPADAADQKVIWSSSSDLIATVDATGKVTGVKAGTVTITATSNIVSSVKTTTTVIVSDVLVTKIDVTPTTLSLVKGQTSQLSASVTPLNATKKTYTWSSSNANVTVDASGNIKAVSVGTATITATAEDASGTKGTCAVTVTPVMPVSIAASDIALLTSETAGKTITYSFTPDSTTNKTVTFLSTDPSVATVDANGLVKPVGVGSTTITITSSALTSVKKVINVNVSATVIEVSSVSLDLTAITLAPGKSQTMKLTINPSDASVTSTVWSTDKATVADVDQNGVITAGVAGTATITVTVKTPGATKTATVVVTVQAILVSSIDVTPATLSLNLASAPSTLVANVLPANATNPSITWASSDDKVVTVSQVGVVTVVGLGTATVSATAKDASAKSGSCVVTVSNVDPISVSLDSTSVLLKVGASVMLKATVAPANAPQTVDWSIVDKTIASIDANGTIKALKAGSTTITATSSAKNTISKTINLVVVSVPVASIVLDKPTLSLNLSSTSTTIKATVNPSDATDPSVTWSVSPTGVVDVVAGVVTVKAVGTATITCTANDASGQKAICVVTVSNVDPTSVTLDATPIALKVGDTKLLSATVQPTNAPQGIVWSSDNEAAAKVDANGTVTAIGVGTANITAKSQALGTISSSVKITVSKVDVISLSVDKTDVTVDDKGNIATVKATINPTNATVSTVTWKSNDETLATVSGGVITGVKAGTTTVTVTSDDNASISKTITVVITHITTVVSVDSVKTNTVAISLQKGASATITPTVYPLTATVKTVTYASDNKLAATVDAKGLVSAVGVGTAIITVTADGGKTTTVIVTVTNTLQSISFNPSSTTCPATSTGLDLSKLIVLSPADAVNVNLNWSVDKTSLATINLSSGVLVPKSSTTTGTVIVTALDPATKLSATISVDITTTIIDVLSVAVLPADTTLNFNQKITAGTIKYKAVITPDNASNKTVSWSVTPAVSGVVIDKSTGVVTISNVVSNATTKIQAISTDGGKIGLATLNLVFKYAVESVEITTPSTSINQGAELQIVGNSLPLVTKKTIAWTIKSSSSTGATISTTGLLKAGTTDGSITVLATVTDDDGSVYTAELVITVKTVVVLQDIVVNNGVNTMNLTKGDTKTIAVTYVPTNTDQTGVKYTTSDPTVVSVSSTGEIIALKGGSATITITPVNATKAKTIVITVIEKVSSISIINVNPSIYIGDKVSIDLTILNVSASDKTVSVKANNSNITIVSVSNTNYTITGISEGDATVTVTANDGSNVTASTTFTVSKIAVQKVLLTKGTPVIVVGNTFQLKYSLTPTSPAPSNKNVIWSSSNSSLLTVSSTGSITAIGQGTATIYVKSADDNSKYDSIVYTINKKSLDLTVITTTHGIASDLLFDPTFTGSLDEKVKMYLYDKTIAAEAIIKSASLPNTIYTQADVDKANQELLDAIAAAKCNCMVGIENLSTINVTLYPNPVNDKLTVRAEGIILIQVIDFLGQKIFETTATDIDFSSYASGVYGIIVQTKEGVSVKSVVKE